MQSPVVARRMLLRTVAASAALAAIPATAVLARDDGAAARLVSELAGQTISLVSDRSLSRADRAKRLQMLIDRGFDTAAISRFVLGRYWRSADAEDRQAFVDLFRAYTAMSYARRFEAYSGQRLSVLDSRPVASDGMPKALVRSQLSNPEGSPVDVDWRLRLGDDGWRIYDVVVEGVSMVLTQRSEFASVIDRHGGDLGPLLDQLRIRVKEMA